MVLAVTPFVWSLPVALLVGELGAALPEEGGFYAWVRRGLGPFWGYEEAWLSLVASVFDMAIYPALFTAYIARLWPAAAQPEIRPVLAVGVVVVAAAMNLRGARSVGSASILTGLAVIVPFVVLTGLLVVRGNAACFAPPPAPEGETAEHVGLVGALLVSMWNAMGWDNASTIAAEVHRPERAYPRGVALALLLVTGTYLVPVGAMAWGARSDRVLLHRRLGGPRARRVGGPALAVAIVLGGMVCGYGMQSALSLSYSRIPLLALADDGFLPPGVRTHRQEVGRADRLHPRLRRGLDPVARSRLPAPPGRARHPSLWLLAGSRARRAGHAAPPRARSPAPRARARRNDRRGAGRRAPMALLVLAAVKNAGETVLGMNALGFGAGLGLLGVPMYFLTRNRCRAWFAARARPEEGRAPG